LYFFSLDDKALGGARRLTVLSGVGDELAASSEEARTVSSNCKGRSIALCLRRNMHRYQQLARVLKFDLQADQHGANSAAVMRQQCFRPSQHPQRLPALDNNGKNKIFVTEIPIPPASIKGKARPRQSNKNGRRCPIAAMTPPAHYLQRHDSSSDRRKRDPAARHGSAPVLQAVPSLVNPNAPIRTSITSPHSPVCSSSTTWGWVGWGRWFVLVSGGASISWARIEGATQGRQEDR
jgi:hypothetical protein